MATHPGSKKVLHRVIWVSLLMIALGAGFFMMTRNTTDAKTKEEEKDKKEDVAIPVEVAQADLGDITAKLVSTTTLEAEDQATVVAKAGGIAEKLYAEEGKYVRAGDPLLQLDTERLKLELAKAQSSLTKLSSDLERTKLLFDKKLVSSDVYDKLRYDYDSQKASFDLSRIDLEYATVRAPITGVVSKRMVKIGNMITLHQPVFEITNFDPLLAAIHVPERELAKLSIGQAANIEIDALRDQVYRAKILRIAPTIDSGSGTFKVTLAVSDDKHVLKPGMFGRVAVTYAQHNQIVLVQKEAVLTEDAQTAVFVVRDGKAYRTAVETGFTDEKHIEISKGLAAGDKIVTTGQNSLKNEAKVDVLNP